ncbi:hypothetical protein [Nguyenibacter sp. L1]|nr:hypothetical protein [Nguyenibacter sp. L1]WRH87223.1 hypothetical protein QN315_14755 [Nguyenibacter sp. L1]
MILTDIADRPYGGPAFSCRDPEDHIRHVGSQRIPFERTRLNG